VENFHTFDEEAAWVPQDIAARSPSERMRCVILARTRRLLEKAVAQLEEADVPAYVSMRKNEFISAPMQWLHSMLRLANARQDREQLRRVCKAFYTLAGLNLDVKDIASAAPTCDGDYLRAFTQASLARSVLAVRTRSFLERAIPKLADRLDFRSFIVDAFAWLDGIPEIAPDISYEFTEYTEERQIWHDLVSEITAQYGVDQVTLHLLLQELDLRSKTPIPPSGAVPCYTIHASKGMEFNHVYLIGLVAVYSLNHFRVLRISSCW
jgi:DNA helicase-2/ATP-dependent DNA helicase PcrA